MLSQIPDDPETRLGRSDGARALTLAGFPTTASTLATKASRGNGPLYQLYGRRAIYTWKNLLEWAQANTSPSGRTATEHSLRAGVAND